MKRLALGGFVLALAACGGGSGGGMLTKAQYDAKLSHLCLSSSDQVHELHISLGLLAWKVDGPRLVRIEKGFVTHMDALKAPDSITSAVTAYRAANEKAIADTQAAVDAAKAGDNAKLQAEIKQSNKDELATYPSAKQIGARDCYFS